ncbi:hypothetical protein C8J56DRAFT_552223 [Mycena floridula]|nr:hypothetical protein C8J56DRAFT_552223 [Mycena floridula]
MAAAPFSRLQLAAALIEYDNDPSNPDVPLRSAHDSAIFAHLRRPAAATRRSDFTGTDTTSVMGGRQSALDRRSGSSIGALRNPFQGAETPEQHDFEEEEEEEELEVDLASWGLDAFMPKTKKGKGKVPRLPNPHPVHSIHSHQPQTNTSAIFPPRRTARSLSVGNYDHLSFQPEDVRRKSFGSPLDLSGLEPPADIPFPPRRSASQGPLDAIPFPTTSTRPSSPFLNDGSTHQRTISMASRDLLNDDPQRHARTISMGSMTSRLLVEESNPFALRPPSQASRFDPKAALHARTMSNASMGSRMLLDNDATSFMSSAALTVQDRPYSTMDLLRPKILVMPSPLQGTAPPPPPPDPKTKDGFHISTDGPPLPPGARSARRSSGFLDDNLNPISSNSFTPNPRMNLSLSQLTFRNTLLVGGQRDVAYSDIDQGIPRATEDGQQIQINLEVVEAPQEPVLTDDPNKLNRPAGKLFGRSLIDDLESRKLEMRTKQRVFTGDNRPSMMSRNTRSSTLIDPATLQNRPASQRMSSYGSNGLARRTSVNAKPLLTFDDEELPQPITPGHRLPNSHSVFGVDTLWERETAKLKQIEAQEKIEAEERARREAEEEANMSKKKKKKSKGKSAPQPLEPEPEPEAPVEVPRISNSPPVLPAFQPAVRAKPPIDEDESDSDESDVAPAPRRSIETTAWKADSSDEEGPRRTTGIGPRFPPKSKERPVLYDDSDEDVPLAATIGQALQRARSDPSKEDSDDEEKPLSVLLQKPKTSLPSMSFDKLSLRNSDDDDEPLGLRASRVAPSSQGHSFVHDEDDQPLALHPEQQRRTQYQMMAQFQQQQQQQQFMLQAQMQSNMFFNPSMMGSGFFGGPMGMQVPMQIPSPPPLHDAGKYNIVDRWRHDVAET